MFDSIISLISSLLYLVPFLIMINILVFFHELGHYLFAIYHGVKVEVFSLGMGKEICGFNDRNGTRWQISWLPIGGYVKFYDDVNLASQADKEIVTNLSQEEQKKTLYYKSPWQKIQIVLAGPIANFILAILLLTPYFFHEGIGYIDPIIHVQEKDKEYRYGFRSGDKIISINGNPVKYFSDIDSKLDKKDGDKEYINTSFIVKRFDNIIEIAVPLSYKKADKTHIADKLSFSPFFQPIIKVIKSSPAFESGLRTGDIIVKMDDNNIEHFVDIFNFLYKYKEEKKQNDIIVKVIRSEETINLNISNFKDKLGVIYYNKNKEYLSFYHSFIESCKFTFSYTKKLVSAISGMIVGKISVKDNLSGPIGIVKHSNNFFHEGFYPFIYLMAIISIGLGFLNLLPIPMLDGGHFVLYLYELIIGKKLSFKVQDIYFKLGFVFLISLILYITWNDILKIEFVQNVIKMVTKIITVGT